MTSAAKPRRTVFEKLALSARDVADLKQMRQRLRQIRHEAEVLKRLCGAIIARGRFAQRVKEGWRPCPAIRLEAPQPPSQPGLF